MYYILTSKKKKAILSTKDISQCFDFIKKHTDARVRRVDYTAKTKILDKRVFLEKYFKLTNNEENTFQLAEIMINGTTNFNYFLQQIGLKEKYLKYREITENKL